MFSKRLALGFALLFFAFLSLLNFTARGVRPLSNARPLEVSRSFAPATEVLPGTKNVAVRTWKLPAAGADAAAAIKFGPFTAPAHLSLWLEGPWDQAGDSVSLEMVGLGLHLPLEISRTKAESRLEEFEIPFGWRGRQVTLIAVAGAQVHPDRLILSEPLRGGGDEVFGFGFSSEVMAFIAVGFFFTAAFWAAAQWLDRLSFPPHWVGLGAGAIVSIAGYGAYWAYFAHPITGKIYSAVFLAGSGLAWIKTPIVTQKKSEWPVVMGLTFVVGLLYISIVYFFGVDRDLYDLASIRFIRGLPGDNRLPHDIGMLLYHGLSPKHPGGDWLSSDRPPLQCGLELLAWPLTRLFGFEESTGSSVGGIWLQLLWISSIYGLLRTVGLEIKRSHAWLAVLALNGLCFINTVYTWPKLCAGAFACGAVGLWFTSADDHPKLRFAFGGAMVALAMLAHGGVVFSIVALGPFVLWSFLRGNGVNWTVAAAVAASLFTPWLCYQKFYEPPGNRLIKWHIGGQIPVDDRGAIQTIREAYGQLSFTEIRDRKLKALETLFEGDWKTSLSTDATGAESRRNDEFNHVGRAFGLWLIFALALPVIAVVNRARGRHLVFRGRGQGFLISWTVLTLIVWCLLLFEPAAIIFLGPYSMMLTGLALFAVWIDAVGKFWLPVLGALQLWQFLTTWTPVSGGVPATLFLPAVVVAVLTMLALAGFFLTSLRSEPPRISG